MGIFDNRLKALQHFNSNDINKEGLNDGGTFSQ